MSFMIPIHLIMEDSAIGHLWWRIYADPTLNHMVSGKAYVRATTGHLQVTIASSAVMTSMVFITAMRHFFEELNCQIYMTQRQLHLTGKYHKCLSASLLQTSQSEYVEYESNKSRLLKEAARFYNNLLVGKPLTDVVPSPLLQKISEIRWHLPPQPASHPYYHPTPSPNLEKLRRRPTYCLSLWQAIGWFPHRYCHLESADEEHQGHWWVN